MAFTYNTLVADLANALPIQATDVNFVAILPQCISYAESRIQQDLDFLSSFVAFPLVTLTPYNRSLSIPDDVDVLQEINIITPIGASTVNGTRNQVVPVSKEFLNATYVSNAYTAIPKYFAMLGSDSVMFGPWPDSAYQAELIGSMKFIPLSPTNQTNYIYTNLAPHYFALCMIFLSGWQKDFGQQSDDPKLAQSWEAIYQGLLSGATTTEARRKFQASAWTSLSQATSATPGR